MTPNVDELLKILKESENDMKYNRVAPISTTFSDLRAILSNDKRKKSRC